MCKRHRDGYKTRELNSDSMYKKRLLCFEESARLRECEVQCFTRGGFFYLFFFSEPKKLFTQERGFLVITIINQGETKRKVQRAKKAKKKGGRCKRTHKNKRTVVTKKREKRINSDL